MTCLIYSTSKDISYNIWTKFNSDEIPKYYKNDSVCLLCNDIIKKGYGFLINVNDQLYVITCEHIIGHGNINSYCFIINKSKTMVKYLLKYINSIPGLFWMDTFHKCDCENCKGELIVCLQCYTEYQNARKIFKCKSCKREIKLNQILTI